MIVFQNDGVIDIKSITTFGVSSKENDSAIGYFGTGLKYAIAILLREGCDITIHSGDDAYHFGTQQQKVRVDEFTFCTMNGEPLPFTTELGKNWLLWMAFRELYCNCMDENGVVFDGDNINHDSSKTSICVTGRAFQDVYLTRHEIILDSSPIHSLGNVDIHQGSSAYVFYKGVRIMNLRNASMYTYNIKSGVDLTEDRTIKNEFYAPYYAAKAILKLEDKTVLRRILTSPDDAWEHGLDFDGEPSGEFVEVCKILAKAHDRSLNKSAKKLCRDHVLEAMESGEMYSLNKVEMLSMQKAIQFNKALGFNVDDYEIIVSEFLGDGVLGRALNEKIYIAKRTVMMGTKQVAVTLLEEFLHLRYQLIDETYSMQNFLFDTIASIGEQMTGEPL